MTRPDDSNNHAQALAAQLRAAERDDELPAELAARLDERAAELEAELADTSVAADGGHRCSECGARLPEEIDDGAGVYCTNCGTGQLVTDGGTEGECHRCSTTTEHTLLDGTVRCKRCQRQVATRNRNASRDAGQNGLDEFAPDGGTGDDAASHSEWPSADDHGVVSDDVQDVRPDGGQPPSDSVLYLLELGCDACRRVSKFVVEYDTPVAVDREIDHDHEHCPYCGAEPDWALLEETRVEKVPPVDELDRGEGIATDGGRDIQMPEKAYSVPVADAEGYMHIGVDTCLDPVPGGGYWVPVADPDLVECQHPPRGHIRQFPKDDRGPARVGPGDVPEHVQNWDYREDVECGEGIATDGGIEPFTDDLDLTPHPWELGRAINGDHVVRFSFHEDRATNVTFCVWGTPESDEWPHEVDGDLNWTSLEFDAATATALAERAGQVKHEIVIDGARVWVSAHVGRSKDSAPARDAPLLDDTAVATDGGTHLTPAEAAERFNDTIDFAAQSADDWLAFLEEHQDLRLIVSDHEGTHAFEYDADLGQVTFLANGSQGYDEAGTRAAMEVAAGQDRPVSIQPREEVVGVSR